MRRASVTLLSFLSFAAIACERGVNLSEIQPALNSITAEALLAHIRVLASDAYEGRSPGTRGEDSTVAYLVNQFQGMGLRPGNPDGTYVQNVDMLGFTVTPTASFQFGNVSMSLKFPDDYVAMSRHDQPQVDVVNSDVIFVGYGIVAPEYGWDDYRGTDVRGKTIVMLINDPPIPSASDSSELDSAVFKGRAMTYYGRWTYKYEIASQKGAAAAIIVHETGPAGYPYDVVKSSWGRENFDIAGDPASANRVPIEAWISLDKAKELFRLAGRDYDAVKLAARERNFVPLPLFGKATFHLKNTVRHVKSRNVIARLDGSDSARKNEYVVYTAHWDHFGRDTTRQGDQIFNGALDNASGVATVLELAKAFTKLSTPPRRSLLFLAVTGEERNLLGAKYYATHPLYPLDHTLADINIDGVNQWGRTSDIVEVGLGNSSLDDVLRMAAEAQHRTVVPDPEPEKGFYYRSDHFEFAKQGVPALDPDAGVQYIGKPADYGTTKRDEYTSKDYHQPSDEIKPDWDLSGAVDDARLLLEVGYRVAQGATFPEWKPGTEFKAKRDSSLRTTRR